MVTATTHPVVPIARAGAVYHVPVHELSAVGLRLDDLVLDQSQRWRSASTFPALRPFLPVPPPSAPSTLATVAKGVAIFGATALATYGAVSFIDHLLTPKPTPRRSLSMADRDAVSRADGWRCVYCGIRVTRRTRHIDHAVSLKNGGADDPHNWVTACKPCNLAKGAMNDDEFLVF